MAAGGLETKKRVGEEIAVDQDQPIHIADCDGCLIGGQDFTHFQLPNHCSLSFHCSIALPPYIPLTEKGRKGGAKEDMWRR